MNLDQRAREAKSDLDGVVDAFDGYGELGMLERFEHYRDRKQRNRRIGAGVIGVVLAILVLASVIRVLGPTQRKTPLQPSPEGGMVVFGRWVPALDKARWFIMKPDGSDVRSLDLVATCAQWWPDGSRFLVGNQLGLGRGEWRPVRVDLDGSGFRVLDSSVPSALKMGCGDVSPNGRRVAVEAFNAKHPPPGEGIFTMRASDGGDLERVTDGPDIYPQYSPDGQWIVTKRKALGRHAPRLGALIVARVDGSSERQITSWGTVEDYGYSWSPDGDWIVFQDNEGRLALVRPDGTELHEIPLDLPDGSKASEPQWSPDGKEIVFVVREERTADVYTARLDGSSLKQITHTPTIIELAPDWGPA